jgi:hypothetical protein
MCFDAIARIYRRREVIFMKHFHTFESFLRESSHVKRVDELRTEDLEKLNTLLSNIKEKIKDTSIYKQIEKFIAFHKVDPYTNYNEIVSWVKEKFGDLLKDNGIEIVAERNKN